MSGPQIVEGPVTIREVYALLGQTRAEILAELHDHERQHEREADGTVSRSRYALTTLLMVLLSLAGNLVAIVLALRGGP